jgi:hypothetical protein
MERSKVVIALGAVVVVMIVAASLVLLRGGDGDKAATKVVTATTVRGAAPPADKGTGAETASSPAPATDGGAGAPPPSTVVGQAAPGAVDEGGTTVGPSQASAQVLSQLLSGVTNSLQQAVNGGGEPRVLTPDEVKALLNSELQKAINNKP